jgi:iron(III) transport system substrate-binding protein
MSGVKVKLIVPVLLATSVIAAAAGDDDDARAGGVPTTESQEADSGAGAADVSGRLVWWTDWTIEQIEAFLEEFNAVYPDVDVEYLRSDDAEMFERFNTEAAAGEVSADVVLIGYEGFSQEWDAGGHLEHYDSPNADALPETAVGPDGAYYIYSGLLEGICYNEEVLESEGVAPPESWEDLADPRFKDLMVMQDILKVGSGAFAWVIDMRHYWEDDEKWETYYEQLGTQNIVFNPDYTAAQQQLVQGEFGVQPVCYLDFIAPAIEQGAPVQWIGVDPVIVVQFTVQIPTGADNLPAAQAFIDYIISEEGQHVISDTVGQVPILEGVPFPELAKSAEGVPQIPALGNPKSAEDHNNNADEYTELIQEWFNLR